MGSRSLQTLIAALGLSVTTVAQPVPRGEAESVAHNFGSVPQGTVVSHTFVLKNTGDAPLRITGVELSPGMRLGRMRAQIAPASQVALAISVDTSGLSGEYEGEALVRLDDPARPSVTFTVSGRVVPTVEFRPYAAFFVTGQRDKGGSGTIEIVNHQDAPLRITRIEHLEDRFTTQLDTIDDGKHYRLTLTLKPGGTPGRRQDAILLHREGGEPLRVMANTNVRERVYTFPDVVDMGELQKSAIEADPAVLQSAAQTLMVYQVGGTAFEAKFSTDVPGLKISAERGPRGDRWQATLTLQRDAIVPGHISGTVIIQTNDPQFPTVKVPVEGAVLDR